jgi:sigma-54 specific flagellar transcriptional regulator A
MAQLLAKAEKVARGDSQVLILGESGTGKELIAEVIHRLSERRSRPVVKVNCAALVETLLLDELFGHEKGAFTGAMQRRKGRFEMAHSGSLFLDEIGDISPKTQVSLLRVLQEQTFERVGGVTPINVDVRLICATNRDLAALVSEGSFREDLYYRLKGITLQMPPLRERPEDIELLAQHFLDRDARSTHCATKTLSKDALDVLLDHAWPGNVRELENVIRSVAIMVDGPEITAEAIVAHSDIGGFQRPSSPPVSCSEATVSSVEPAPTAPTESPPIEIDGDDELDGPSKSTYDEVIDGELSLREWQKELERGCIEKALERTGWNITQAAKLLGMKRPRLSQLVKEHGLNGGRQAS